MWQQYETYLRKSSQAHFMRHSDRFPLSAVDASNYTASFLSIAIQHWTLGGRVGHGNPLRFYIRLHSLRNTSTTTTAMAHCQLLRLREPKCHLSRGFTGVTGLPYNAKSRRHHRAADGFRLLRWFSCDLAEDRVNIFSCPRRFSALLNPLTVTCTAFPLDEGQGDYDSNYRHWHPF